MEIREVQNKEEWEEFLENCAEKTFLQSWSWGEFNLAMNSKIWRFGAYSERKLMAFALIIKVVARRGTFLFIPHGPIILENLTIKDKKEILELLILRSKEIGATEGASFIRISPLFLMNEENQNIFEDLGFRESPMHASAYEATWKLDIYPPEEELLKNMRETTRYLIKKAIKDENIYIEKTSEFKGVEIYQKLNKEVSKRQKFIPFSDNFVKNEFETFAKNGQAILLLGKYKGEIAAGALIIFWAEIGFYHQAASLEKFAKLSIPYLLQWEAIREAKKRGCSVYDFWGFVDPKMFPKHPWAGPTLFKMGFGGYKEEYVKTQDFVISKKYWTNYIIEKIRKFYRGL